MNYKVRMLFIVSAAAFFCASLLAVRGVMTQGGPGASQAAASLREKARRSGKAAVKVFPRSLTRYDDLDALAKDSRDIVLGTVVSQASSLTAPSESMVNTDYKIEVGEVFKGGLSKGSLFSLNMAGGKVSFEDGTSAEVAMPDYWKTPQAERTYVFFLSPGEGGGYNLVGGPQGLFEVSPAGIKPQGLASDDMFRGNDGLSLKSFTHRIRSALEKQERAGSEPAAD